MPAVTVLLVAVVSAFGLGLTLGHMWGWTSRQETIGVLQNEINALVEHKTALRRELEELKRERAA